MDELFTISDEEYMRIAATLRTLRNIDLSYYQPVITKHRFARFAKAHGYTSTSMLIEKLQYDKKIADMLIDGIKVQTTEMFRDPQTWIELESILRDKLNQESIIKIWIPDICGDDELNSMLVALSRCKMLHKAMVYATSVNQGCISNAQKGEIDCKKYEASDANFKRMNAENNLQSYVTNCDKSYRFSPQLLEKAIFIKQSVLSDPPPDNGFNLILFRNRTLYYTQMAQKRLIESLTKSLLAGGYLVMGVGESISGLEQAAQYTQVSKTEKIFRKKY